MKKTYISLATVLAFSSSSLIAAQTLEEAFKSGKVEGHIGVYAQQYDYKHAQKEGFVSGNIALAYETAPLHNFSLGMAAWGDGKLGEKHDGNYDSAIAKKGVLHQAYIKYDDEKHLKAIIGRQEMDFMWMTDFVEGATVELSYIDNLVLTLAWARRQAVVDVDEVSDFEKMNGNDGVYMIDAKYTPIAWLEINPFYYHASDLFNAPGIKVTLSFEPKEDFKTATMLAYTKGNSDIAGEPDGYVAQIEQGFEFKAFNLGVGYVKVDKEGTARLESFGDQMPFEDGNYIFAPDAKTPYIFASYNIESIGVTLGAMYGETSYKDAGEKFKEKEFSASIGYEVIKNLEASLIYVNVKNNDDTNGDSYDAIKAGLAYKF